MKRTILPILLTLMCLSAHAATWYVNSTTGGTRYSSANPNGQCNGQSNSAYPGTGTNKPCPFNDPRLLWTDPYAYQNASWVLASGDTAILETGGQISGSLDASSQGKFCFGTGAQCVPPDLPSGTSAAHTRLLGANYASCSTSKTFTDASAPTLVGDPAKQTFLTAYTLTGQTPFYALSVASSKYVDLECLDLSSNGGRSGSGIWSGNADVPVNSDILIQDTTIHGFADSAWRGNIGGTWNLIRDTFQFNAQAGVNNDPGNNQPSTGSIIGSYVSIFGNGCSEEYPIVHAFAGVNCKDQNDGGYGDGWGTSVTANLNFYCDHCLAAYNTQDGVDLGHVVNSTISITNTQMYGNMGGNLKGGPGAITTFSNDLINANCMRMHDPINGAAPGFNNGLTLWCRAGDQNSVAALTSAIALDGQMQSSGTNVTGTGTHFLAQLTVGTKILPGAELLSTFTRTVTAINSDTSLTVSSAFPNDIGSNQPIVVIPSGGAVSTSVLTIESSSFVGYGATMWDIPCQTGMPQTQVDPVLCAGATFVYKNNISLAYAEATYNQGQSPGPFYNLAPTEEDYNLFYGFRNPYGSGAHDVQTSPLFVGQPAKPLTAEPQMDRYNFSLSSGSPAKWVGVSLPGLATDFNGAARHGPPSMGALELGSAAPSLPVPQVSLNVTANPALVLQPVTFTVTMTGTGTTPTGTVSFSVSGVALGTVTLNSSGVATVTTSTLAAGVYLTTASYSGDANYAAATSSGVSLTVNATSKTAAQVGLGLSSNAINAQQTVTFTSTVVTVGGVAPTGTTTFYLGGVSVGQSSLSGSGSATFSTSSLTAGTYAVTASYSGDGIYATGTSSIVTLTVNGTSKITSPLTLSLSSNTISTGQSLSFAAAVTNVGGVTPTGIITFYLGGLPLGQAALDTNGTAAIPVTLAAGNYTVTSSYSGDSVYASAISSAATLTVTGAAKTVTQVTLGLSSNTITALQPVTLSTNVAAVGGVAPTGTITFYLGGVSLGQSALNGSGSAALSTSSLIAGTYVITASYSGDTTYSSGSSNTATLTVNGVAKTTAQVTLGLSSNTIATLQPVTIFTNVAAASGVTPTGTITFYLDGVYVGQSLLNGSGSAALSTSSLTAGAYVVAVSYSGDNSYSSGTSNAATLTVNPAGKSSAQLTLNISSSSITVSQPVTLTAVAATVGGVAPTGPVTFTAGGVTIGTGTLNGAGVATFTTSSLTVGTYLTVASYSGDTSFTSGVSNSASLTVNAVQASVSIRVGQPEFGFNVIPGSTRRIFATVDQGHTNQVVWTLKSGTATLSSNASSWIDVTAPATGSSCSMELSNGIYAVTSTTQFTVSATAVDDGTKTTDLTFNVCSPAVQVSVVPFYRTLYAKQPADIQSLITGSVDQNVHWAITSKPLGGDGTLGDTTSRDTVFAASVAGRYTLTATSQADPSKTASAVVYVSGNTIPYAGPVTPNQTEPVDCSVDPAMAGTVYNVGPSQAFKTLAAVPFPTMVAGSTVRLFNEDSSGINPTTYHEYIQISQAGTATQPIRICGVPDGSGHQPVIDGSGATGRSDTSVATAGLGLLTLHKDNNASVWPNYSGAAYIAVEGIHFRNAKTGYSYVAPNGSTGAWGSSSACVRVNQGQNLAFVGNDLDNCGDGVYTAWNDDGGWGSSDLNVLWEGNHLHNNGVANSDSHQMYLEAWGEVVQFNRLDNYTSGGLGANLKSRGVQDVIRYNYFGDGPMRQMDLVDVTNGPTYMSFSGFLHGGAGSYHGANPADGYSADQLAAEQEAWNSHFAYGNIYQNSVSAAPIHFAMDTNGEEQARKGSLYWYNNTFNETACAGCPGRTLTLFDTSAGNGNYIPQTEFQTVQSFNNIVWLSDPTQTTFQWNNYDAFIGVSGATLITANWGTNNAAGGPGSGWNATSNPTAYQNAEKVELHLTGFSDKLVTATTIPFSPASWALNADLQGNQGVPNAVCEMPPRFSYMPSLGYAIARITGPNMGATDTTAEAAAMMTTLVGPKQYNTHYANCR